jgi:hypothetical protein
MMITRVWGDPLRISGRSRPVADIAIALALLALVPLTAQAQTLSETRVQFARGAISLLT